MKSLPSTVLILIMFVSIYIFCVSTYTFIAALNNVNLWIGKENSQEDYNELSRFKREDMGEIDVKNISLSDSWKTNITFNICCGSNEYLNPNFQCVQSNRTSASDAGGTEETTLLSEIAVVDENLTQNSINKSRVLSKYNSGIFCPTDEFKIVTWLPDKSHSYYISQKDGHMLELSDDRKSVISNFSTASYCINQMLGTEKQYSAVICPCIENVCIQKCCKKGYYYNIIDNTCKEEREYNITPYKPTFYDKNVENTAQIPYNLIHSDLNCSGPDKLMENGSTHSPLYIQKTGQLMLTLEKDIKVFVDPKQYCVDVFSNGSYNSRYVNGFYCQNFIDLEIGKMDDDIDDGKVEAIQSSDIRYIANFNLFIMMISILFFVM